MLSFMSTENNTKCSTYPSKKRCKQKRTLSGMRRVLMSFVCCFIAFLLSINIKRKEIRFIMTRKQRTKISFMIISQEEACSTPLLPCFRQVQTYFSLLP